MKKLLILFCIVAFAQRVQAQATQGSVVATGSFNYFSSTGEGKNTTNTHSFNFSPQIGYLVADNLEIGLFGSLHKRAEDYDRRYSGDEREYGESKSTERAIGVYLKKYLFLTDKVAFSGTGEVSYNNYRSTTETYAEGSGFRRLEHDYLYKTSSFEVSIRPGFSFFLSEKIALNATYGALSYTIESLDYSDYQHHNSQAPQQYQDERKTQNLKLDFSSASSSLGLSYFF